MPDIYDAKQIAEELPPSETVVTILPDRSDRYPPPISSVSSASTARLRDNRYPESVDRICRSGANIGPGPVQSIQVLIEGVE